MEHAKPGRWWPSNALNSSRYFATYGYRASERPTTAADCRSAKNCFRTVYHSLPYLVPEVDQARPTVILLAESDRNARPKRKESGCRRRARFTLPAAAIAKSVKPNLPEWQTCPHSIVANPHEIPRVIALLGDQGTPLPDLNNLLNILRRR